jgi:hypothetical protein
MNRNRIGLSRLLLVVAASALFLLPAFALEHFNSEIEAQHHCPNDTVVWLNLPTMIWHYRGQRWYGKTRHGAYVCEKEAAVNGARATRNGE